MWQEVPARVLWPFLVRLPPANVTNGPGMQTKISVAVGSTRKSVLTDNPSISANGSHVVIDVEGDQGDLISMLLDRDCVLRILQDGYRAGMFDRLLAGPLHPDA